MGLVLKEDLDYNEIVYTAFGVVKSVIKKHNITCFDEFECGLMRALAEELYEEE